MDQATREAIEFLHDQKLMVVVTPKDWRLEIPEHDRSPAVDDWEVWVDLVHVDNIESFQGYSGGASVEEAIRNAARRLKTEG